MRVLEVLSIYDAENTNGGIQAIVSLRYRLTYHTLMYRILELAFVSTSKVSISS